MMNPPDFLTRLEVYCRDTGLSHATVCGKATKNARWFLRWKRRLEMFESDAVAIERFMTANPPERVKAPTEATR